MNPRQWNEEEGGPTHFVRYAQACRWFQIHFRGVQIELWETRFVSFNERLGLGSSTSVFAS